MGFLFDYETTPVHNLTFMANDGTDNSDPATLCLVIVNINEPPTFQSPVYYITFNENVVNAFIVFLFPNKIKCKLCILMHMMNMHEQPLVMDFCHHVM